MALTSKPVSFFAKDTTLKFIQEYFGKPSTGQEDISIAVMTALPNWKEPAQIAEFDEYIYMISGELKVNLEDKKIINMFANDALHVPKGKKVQFSTEGNPAHYIAICTPAFQEHLVKRDEK